MGASVDWPLDVTAFSAVTTGSRLWHVGGQLHVTLVVKAQFRLRGGEPPLLTSPPLIAREDQHYEGSPLRSLQLASDLAPYRQRCDVSLVGHCFAPPGQAVGKAAVRLALYRGERALIDKVLHVYGDRRNAEERPAAFERMPLRYERAFGGPDVLNNPVGVGMRDGDPQPNVIHPQFPSRPAGFGPIARFWRSRLFELPQQQRDQLDMPVIAIPDGFDWSYFQTAPRDQQTEPLLGGEWLVLDGVHPAEPRVQCRLPAVRARARLWSVHASPAVPGHEIGLVADTLAIDADDQTFCVSWRGSFPLQAVEILQTIRVGVGLEEPGASFDWQPYWDAAASADAERSPPDSAGVAVDASGTVVSLAPAPPARHAAIRGDEPASTTGPSLGQTVEHWPPLSVAGEKKQERPPHRMAMVPPPGPKAERKAQPADAASSHRDAPDGSAAPLRPAAVPGAPWEQVVVPARAGQTAIDPLARTTPSSLPPSLNPVAAPPSIPPPSCVPAVAPDELPAPAAEQGAHATASTAEDD